MLLLPHSRVTFVMRTYRQRHHRGKKWLRTPMLPIVQEIIHTYIERVVPGDAGGEARQCQEDGQGKEGACGSGSATTKSTHSSFCTTDRRCAAFLLWLHLEAS
jgi:hypothetical protein